MHSSNLSMSLAQMRLRSTSISNNKLFSCLMTRVALISSFLTLSQSPSATLFSILLLWFFSRPKWWGMPTSLNFWMDNSARFNGIGDSMLAIVALVHQARTNKGCFPRESNNVFLDPTLIPNKSIKTSAVAHLDVLCDCSQQQRYNFTQRNKTK